MSAPRQQFCFNCGKSLGVYQHYHGDVESCGEKECEREARNLYLEERDDRAESAREDDYGRY